MSVFESYKPHAYPFAFRGQLEVTNLAGGTPSDPKVAEAWLRSKFHDKDSLIRRMVNETMQQRGVLGGAVDQLLDDPDGLDEATMLRLTDEAIEDAIPAVNMLKHLNGFKRDPDRGLYIEGRHLKSALKEATSVAMAAGKLAARGWGKTNKGLQGYFNEHVFVVEDYLYLGLDQPDDLEQRFVHTWRGTGIQYEEIVRSATIDFTLTTDHEFSEREWAMIWLTGGQQGIGASRSQGHGRYEVTAWEPLAGAAKAAVTRKTSRRTAA